MNSIIYDGKIITPEGNKYQHYRKFTKKLNTRDCVKLGLFCAKIANTNTNNKESNDCIEVIEKWLLDKNSVSIQELKNISYTANVFANNAIHNSIIPDFNVYSIDVATYAVDCITYINHCSASDAVWSAINANADIDKINKYLQILLRKTKQFQNNKILEQISKTDVDRLELVDWNMITDIMQEEYDIIHEFSYEDIFSRRCLIELLRREYTKS